MILRLTFIFGFITAASAFGGTYTAASCSYTDVNAVINGPTHTVVSGDVIVIPGTACTWTSNLVGPSGVGFTLAGTGTPNSTSGTTGAASSCTATQITDNAGSSLPLMNFTPSYGVATMRISCMDIEPYSTSTALTAPVTIAGNCASGGCPAFRIDNLTFGLNTPWSNSGNSSQSGAVIRVDNSFGVMDHNTVPSNSSVELFNAQLTAYFGTGANGDNSWAQPDSLGGANNVFAENNLFYSGYLGLNDCEAGYIGGCRVVDRYNTLTQTTTGSFGIFQNHGTETAGRGRSGREAEVYNNTLTCVGACAGVDGGLRGGTGMFFNNHANLTPGQGANTWLGISLYRTDASFPPWGACGGSGGYDQNDGTVYYSGTITSSSGGYPNPLVMTDTSKSWTTNQFIPVGDPYSVYDVTQGFWIEIASNTNNSLTTQSPVVEGQYSFTNGDSYQILRSSLCIDQPGRGAGTYLSGTTPTPTGYPSQPLDPIYQWGDSFSGGASVNAPIGSGSGKIISYRDFYVQSSGIQTNSTTPFSCNGSTGGAGWGTLANRPSSCSGGCSANTPGCGYFATDQGSQGTLYVWSSGAWTSYYQPYTYPHPLTSPTCSLSPSSIGPYTAGQSVSQSFSESSCSGSTYTISSGSLSGSGLSLNSSTGVLSGTATAGSFSFTVAYSTATDPITLTINAAPSITTSSLLAGLVGTAYSQALATSGGTGAISCAVTSGSLPTGLSLSGCTISGTPTVANTYSFSITPTDANSVAGSAKALSILINSAGTNRPAPPTHLMVIVH